MTHRAASRADALSGGEQQRVGIARALAQQPKFMLADEPVASLDPKTSRVVLTYLKKSCKESNIAVLCNLHQIDYALDFVDRAVDLVKVAQDRDVGFLADRKSTRLNSSHTVISNAAFCLKKTITRIT